jgi:hypothetical protein
MPRRLSVDPGYARDLRPMKGARALPMYDDNKLPSPSQSKLRRQLKTIDGGQPARRRHNFARYSGVY